MKTRYILFLVVSIVLGGCAADNGGDPEVEAVGDDLQRELLDVLAATDEENVDGADARERLFSRLASLRERYEAALAEGGPSASVAPLRDPSARRDLVVVGDSVSSGGSADGLPGWVERLESRHPARNIANLAVGGTTAMGWAGERPDRVAALDAELARRPDTVVVLLGGNDVLTFEPYYDDGRADAGSLGRAIQGLLGVITHIRLRSPGSRIVLGTYYDLFDLKSFLIPASTPISGLPGSQFHGTSWNTIALNLIIHALGAITGADVVDLYAPFMNHAYGNVWLSGGNAPYVSPATFDVHPNGAGQEAIYRAFRAGLGY